MLGKGLLAACCAVAALAAQDSGPASRAASEFTLENGLRVRLVPLDIPGEVGVVLGVGGAGIMSEPAGMAHLAHVSEHAICLARPAPPLDAGLVQRWSRESRANAETLPEMMYFDLHPEPGELELAITVQAARLFAPRLGAKILEREKVAALGEITHLESQLKDQQIDFLAKFAWCPFNQAAFHGAMSVDIRADTARIDVEAVAKFHARTFRPERAMLTVAGDFDPAKVRPMIEDRFRAKAAAAGAPASRPVASPGRVTCSWDFASDHVFVAWPSPPPSDPAHPALALVSQRAWLVSATSREIGALARQGAAVSSDAEGWFVFGLSPRARDGRDAVARAIPDLFSQLASHEWKGTDLRTVKGAIRMRMLGARTGRTARQHPPGQVRRILGPLNAELGRMRATLSLGEPPEAYCARTDAVTFEDIREAIRKHLAPEKATIVTITGKE